MDCYMLLTHSLWLLMLLFIQTTFIYYWMLLVKMENVSSSHRMQPTAFWHVYVTVQMMCVPFALLHCLLFKIQCDIVIL